jgi:hypothetical protein
VLSDLSRRLISRDLLAIELQNEPFPEERINSFRSLASSRLKIDEQIIDYYVFTNSISNLTYAPDSPEARILLKNGSAADFTSVSDMFDHRLLTERITKYFLCYPKECRW